MFQVTTQSRATLVVRQIGDRQARGNYAKPRIECSEFAQERLEGRLTQPSFCEPGGFWSGSRPSRTSKVRRCAISLANLSPFSKAVPIRGSGSPNQEGA